MGKTNIEWTDESVNPIRARKGDATGHYCEKLSSGCAFCYASRMQVRFKMPTFPGHGKPSKDVEVFFDPKRLEAVLKRKKPTKYFWCDMTDLFGHWVKDEWIDQCLAVMALTPWHTHQILTKRPERAVEYLTDGWVDGNAWFSSANQRALRLIKCMLPDPLVKRVYGRLRSNTTHIAWPLPNVWIGTSVENQEQANERIPWLLKVPAAVRFLSCEPLLGAIDLRNVHVSANDKPIPEGSPQPLTRLSDLDCLTGNYITSGRMGGFGHSGGPTVQWVICGGESGTGARPMHPEWARSLRDQCVATSVPVHFKQWGAWAPGESIDKTIPRSEEAVWFVDGRESARARVNRRDHENGLLDPEPDLYRAGKKAAGRVLDGQTWDQFPEVQHA